GPCSPSSVPVSSPPRVKVLLLRRGMRQPAVRLLSDYNIPGDAVAALRLAGHDVAWIRLDAPGSVDGDVLARAQAETRNRTYPPGRACTRRTDRSQWARVMQASPCRVRPEHSRRPAGSHCRNPTRHSPGSGCT